MSLFEQARPKFKTIEECEVFITSKEESLIFWTMVTSIDTAFKVRELRNDIFEAKKLLLELKNKGRSQYESK